MTQVEKILTDAEVFLRQRAEEFIRYKGLEVEYKQWLFARFAKELGFENRTNDDRSRQSS
jgi:hypothetical protein